jgi:hypothetical protein
VVAMMAMMIRRRFDYHALFDERALVANHQCLERLGLSKFDEHHGFHLDSMQKRGLMQCFRVEAR